MRLYETLAGENYFPLESEEHDLTNAKDPSKRPEKYRGSNTERSLSVKKKILEMHAAGRTERNIAARYPWYKRYMLPAFRRSVDGTLDRNQSIADIKQSTDKKFREHRRLGGIVQGSTLRQWARSRAMTTGSSWFKASDRWLNNFKINFRISSQKITDYRGRSDIAREQDIKREMGEFKHEFRLLRGYFHSRRILNTDQSGFQYEASRHRTLSTTCKRDTVAYTGGRD